MQAVTFRQETEASSTDPTMAARPTRRRMSRADRAVMIAVLAPMLSLGVLVLLGVGVTLAVCATFVLVFAVITTMDVRWWLLERRPRRAHERCGSES